MREAYVVGAGQTAFGAAPDRSDRDLFREAVERARDSVPKGMDRGEIDEAVVGTLGVGGRQIGLPAPALTTAAGLGETPSTRVENACAAGGYAVRQAVRAVQGGHADVVLAGGVEVMTDAGDATRYWLGVSGETPWERLSGATFAGVYAQMADAYLDAHGASVADLSAVTAKNHANGAKNDKAHLDFPVSATDATDAAPVADPLTLYHCCPTSDGAAAVLVASEDVVEDYDGRPIRVAGVGCASDRVGLYERDAYTRIPAAEGAAERAYDAAGIGPNEIDVAEVHDCFAIAELLAYEDLGFCDRGEAPALVAEGRTELDGALPVNPSGGLESKGHPIGATGAGQVVELVAQLRGEGGKRQIEGAERALAHNVGGSGGAAVVTVLEGER